MVRRTGFTLIELAVVLAVIGLVLASAVQATRLMGEAQHVRDTRAQLSEIHEALLGFAVSTGHLPCPANPAAVGAGSGVEDRAAAGGCNRLQGLLPWATLGLGQNDAFGRPFSYRVTGYYADTDPATVGYCFGAKPPASVTFAMCSRGDITVRPAAGSAEILAQGVVAVVVSHGSHGPGPLQPGGAGDEAANADNDVEFVSHDRTDAANGAVTYDDLTDWLAPTTLLSRMLVAGRLP
ncbi:type II secretion system protein [Jeongeupia naejangsanensis]|uniref:Type II secretion system protein n=1 Tax=Jeongeupia naejangsanensis TaxID=613195 RepID=A0ABS2BKK6_9NEIS|nr:type II secretion system protein [Jeongeupia naejangsanensis]MBM3115960.1 type II secretion system protein [Jeongeupia naejangsanensis]